MRLKIIICGISVLLGTASLRAQSLYNEVPASFFTTMTADASKGLSPQLASSVKFCDSLETASVADVAIEYPDIMVGLTSQSYKVREIAALALLVLSRRKDSATIFEARLPLVLGGLDDQDMPVRRFIGQMFVYIDPGVAKPFAPKLRAKLETKDAYLTPYLVRGLVRIAPDEPTTLSSISDALTEAKSNLQLKTAILQGLAVPNMTNRGLQALIGNELESTRPVTIRIVALHALQKIGSSALASHATAIQQLSSDPSVPTRYREEAAHLLNGGTH